MSDYIDWDVATALSGVSDSLTADIKTAIEQWVEELKIKMTLGTDFASHTVSSDDPELYSVGDFQDSIILMHHPVISMIRVRDNIRASSPTTLVEGDDYTVDKKAGIIYLIPSSDVTVLTALDSDFQYGNYFTSGKNVVDVSYVYGFSSIPDDVIAYANVCAAKMIRMWSKFYNDNDIEGFTMGDYTERVGAWSKMLDSQLIQ